MTSPRPAEQLLGKILDGGWVVVRKLPKANDTSAATGGNFSVGYVVEQTSGRQAFLKALDYSRALKSAQPAEELRRLASEYLFERDLHERCNERRMRRVVRSIASGAVTVDPKNPVGVVEYLILELAESDVRAHVHNWHALDLACEILSNVVDR